MVKIKEWPPKLYNEYNGIETSGDKKKEKTNLFKLLIHAPRAFWTVSLVQFFSWIAFLFMWTYTTGTIAHTAFHTPQAERVVGLEVNDATGSHLYEGKYLLINDTIPIAVAGKPTVAGVDIGGVFFPASNINVGDQSIVKDRFVQTNTNGIDLASFGKPVELGDNSLVLDGKAINTEGKPVYIKDYLSQINGAFTLTVASVMARDKHTGAIVVEDKQEYPVADRNGASFSTKIDLNTASKAYNDAGDWVGILFAIQAVGSVIWAMLLPRIGNRKFSYTLSLVLGAVGFIGVAFISNQWLLFVPFLLIGCAWAAMLAWPFTILTNSLKGGNIGAYLGLFNCSITIPQIVGALAGGWLLGLFSTPGQLAPQYVMMILAGVSLAIGAFCVSFIKEKTVENLSPKEAPEESETI